MSERVLNHEELTRKISEKTRMRHHSYAYRMMSVLIQLMIEELQKGGKVRLRGFGVFSIVESKPKKIRGFNGEQLSLKNKKKIKFTVSKPLKKLLNKEQ